MSSAFDVKTVVVNTGAFTNTTRPLFEVPSAGGGITILNADIVSAAAGTATLQLVTMQGGTLINGTLGAGAVGTFVAATPHAFTLTSDWVDGGYWVGVKEANAGTTNTNTFISVQYVLGRG